METNHLEDLKKQKGLKGAALADCLFNENSMFTVVGVGVGLAAGLHRKNLRPFVAAVAIGTLSDMVYGYTYNCRQRLEEFQQAEAEYNKAKRQEEPVEK